MNVVARVPQRDISIILGTGAEDLKKIGIKPNDKYEFCFSYSIQGKPVDAKVDIYDAEIGGVPVSLLSRHSEGEYTPAYFVDHTSNIYALVLAEKGPQSKVILASSLVGGCRTTDWQVGDKVVAVDGIDEHADTKYVDGIDPYVHGHGLFDRNISELLVRTGDKLGIYVRDGGIYYSAPWTTGARFETKAEMANLLAPAYVLKKEIERLKGRYFLTKNDRKTLKEYEHLLSLQPNAVGMTLVREAGRVRTFSTGRNDNYPTKFGGVFVISDFPEDEETDHGKNVEIALRELPKVTELFADAIPRINWRLKKEKN